MERYVRGKFYIAKQGCQLIAVIILVLHIIMARYTEPCYACSDQYSNKDYGFAITDKSVTPEISSKNFLLKYWGETREGLDQEISTALFICESALDFVERELRVKLPFKVVINWIPRDLVFSAGVIFPSTINIYSGSFKDFGVRLFIHELVHIFANELMGVANSERTRFFEEMFADGIASLYLTDDKLAVRSHYQTWLTFKVDSNLRRISLLEMMIGKPESMGNTPLETLFFANSLGAFIGKTYGSKGLMQLYLSIPSQREIQTSSWAVANSTINTAISGSLGASTHDLEMKWWEYLNDFALQRKLSLYEELFSLYYFNIHKPLIATGRISGLLYEGLIDERILDQIRELLNELENRILSGVGPDIIEIDHYKIRVQELTIN